jgi:DNA polymerase-1
MQTLIDNFYDSFPQVREFVERCHVAVRDPGYVENAYGRRRYFGYSRDHGIMKAKERQAQNAPIQGTVADALSIALCNLFVYRVDTDMRFKLILPVHDAIFLMTPFDEIKRVTEEVFPTCMSDRVPIPGTELKLGIDIEVMERWGDKLSANEVESLIESNGVK